MMVKTMINRLVNEANHGIEELTGADKVMAQIGLANVLCNFLRVPGVSAGKFEEVQNEIEAKGEKPARKRKKPAAPATKEELAEPPQAKVAAPVQEETVESEPVAETAPEPVAETAPVQEASVAAEAVPEVTDETPSFDAWGDDAMAYYAEGMDELSQIILNNGYTEDELDATINGLMDAFTGGLVKTFAESSPNTFTAFLTYVKECASTAANEAVAG